MSLISGGIAFYVQGWQPFLHLSKWVKHLFKWALIVTALVLSFKDKLRGIMLSS